MLSVFRYITFGIAILLTQELGAAEITDKYSDNKINIDGEIVKGDYNKMISYIKELGYIPDRMTINSPGGDVLEAIKIGQFARRALMHIASEDCNSSCFLILAGGVDRRAHRLVGIHRPVYGKEYFSGLSYEDAQKEYEKLNDIVRKYLIEMDVSIDIVEKMMSTPNENVFMLEVWNPTFRGIRSPAYHEWASAKCGTLTEHEGRDYEEMTRAELYGILGDKEDDIHKRYAKKLASMSKGYREYLKNTQEKIENCERESAKIERKKIYSRLN